ncbi:MAG: bifunctional oligoribonuclease/PAP phosphatase NrnA [Planctomycetes bacterium]|nr:bifunctional oligoribonuclease/PAP phosphatase NrnA [Planctomycetota bacterium]
MTYRSTVNHAQMAAMLRSARRPFVTTHFKPDGDALGSALALGRALRALGAEVDVAVAGPIDRSILGLAQPGEHRHADRGPVEPGPGCDLAVVVDTGAWSQLEHCRDWLRANASMVAGIDHHARGDLVAPARIVDVSCASCTQVLVPILDELGASLGPGTRRARHTVAEALFAGLATDTGWFRFSGADDRVFALAARLLACGVDKDALFRMVEQGDAPGRPLLTARALSSLRYACGGRVAVMRLARADFEATGTRVDDLAGLVNEPMSVAEVEVSVLLVESEPRLTKASFRSKPPAAPGGAFVDVNHLAARFEGGGHVHAAGARIAASLDEAADLAARACEDYLESGS